MYNHDRRPSDLDTLSSFTSDATSRVTPIPYSWSATALQEKLKQLTQYNNHLMDDDQSSVSTTTTTQDTTVVGRNVNGRRDSLSPSDSTITQNHHHHQQQSWVNPYWDHKSNSDSTATHSSTNQTASNAGDASSQQHVKQLIPGSILINDQGEIDDLLWKKNNTGLNSSTSSASFNPGGQYISDESGGAGGFLAPIHTQRRSAQSSSNQIARSANATSSNQTAASPSTTNHSNQPWVNPYWSNTNQTSSKNAVTNTSQPWVNPYWPKTNQTGSGNAVANTSQPTNNSKPSPVKNNSKSSSVKNNYVNTNPSQRATTATTEAWQNPYWKENNNNNNNNNNNSNATKQNSNTNASNKSASFPYKIPSIPTFYQRIYPPPSPVPSFANPPQETIFSTRKSEVHAHDDGDDLPYTFDSHNVVRYRATTSAPNATNNTPNTAAARPPSQYPVSSVPQSSRPTSYPSTTSHTAPSYPSRSPPTVFPNANRYPSSSYQYNIPALSNSALVLTESDLNSIHNALRLLETNPNAIPVIEAPNRIPSPSSHHRQNPLAAFASILKPQPSTFSHSVQGNSQRPPLFSTPSYPDPSHQSISRLTQQGKVVLI